MPTTLDKLIATVTALNRLIAQRLHQQQQRHANTQLQLGMLQFLATHPHTTVTVIARQMHLSLPSVTQVLRRVERAKLIIRRADQHDRRSVRYQLSTFGQRHLRDLQEAQRQDMRKLFSGVTPAQLRQMIKVLQAMLKNISQS